MINCTISKNASDRNSFPSSQSTPTIYVACLAAYNNGYLHGIWINAIEDVKVIYKKIYQMLSESPVANYDACEEWAIHDYENFYDLRIDEYAGIEQVHAFAEFISKHGELGAKLLSHYEGFLEEAKQAINDHYHGEWDEEIEFIRAFFYECYGSEIPDNISCYLDYNLICRDFFITDFFSISSGGKKHIFNYI